MKDQVSNKEGRKLLERMQSSQQKKADKRKKAEDMSSLPSLVVAKPSLNNADWDGTEIGYIAPEAVLRYLQFII